MHVSCRILGCFACIVARVYGHWFDERMCRGFLCSSFRMGLPCAGCLVYLYSRISGISLCLCLAGVPCNLRACRMLFSFLLCKTFLSRIAYHSSINLFVVQHKAHYSTPCVHLAWITLYARSLSFRRPYPMTLKYPYLPYLPLGRRAHLCISTFVHQAALECSTVGVHRNGIRRHGEKIETKEP